MKRYEAEINGGEPWHEPADDGMWVMYDDAQAAIDAAVAVERERLARVRELASQCAEWHIGDGDECGEIARELYELLRPKVESKWPRSGQPGAVAGTHCDLRDVRHVASPARRDAVVQRKDAAEA